MTTKLPKPQALQSLDPRDYKLVVCVAGTRFWNDRRYFHEKMLEFVEDQTEPILFVSGAATSGADDLIIRWCAKFAYPCLKMPADWDNAQGLPNFNRGAQGFIRNEKMSLIINYLMAFWDGISNGTGHMIECCEKRKIPMQQFKIPTPPKPNYYGRQTNS